MSFAAQTKKELTLMEEPPCCIRAELEAVLAFNGVIRSSADRRILEVETENVATARRIYTGLKTQFGVHPEVVVRRKMRLKKNNVYALRLPMAEAGRVLSELGWAAEADSGPLSPPAPRKRKPCCRKAFLRGAFLAAGSVNDPGSSSYHLEITANTRELAEQVLLLMNRSYGLHAKWIQRKRGYVVYLKEGEKIVEFLSIIGAHQALLKFEDVRILKDMRNQVNRLVNCETANLNKAIGAAVRQIETIRYIDSHLGLDNLPGHLREAAELRLRYPEVNLQELTARMPHKVSKSGLNHRFRKLEQIAESLRNGG
ncbi:MAG: DNA-binding protein WhiA [Alicyclobacillus sp.]|nr:DNA-binding protein WhiA [Alicyclobacillus sp.]